MLSRRLMAQMEPVFRFSGYRPLSGCAIQVGYAATQSCWKKLVEEAPSYTSRDKVKTAVSSQTGKKP